MTKEFDRYAQKLQIQALDKKLNERIGTSFELIFDPEFRQVYFSNYPYVETIIFIAVWFADHSLLTTLLLILAVGFLVITTFFDAKNRIKIRVLNQALELRKLYEKEQENENNIT